MLGCDCIETAKSTADLIWAAIIRSPLNMTNELTVAIPRANYHARAITVSFTGNNPYSRVIKGSF